ncbi:hypothetical protein HPB51_021048 [Rhipicephalus microplus]|uniref:Reverse transcriptase domain-containing protein n=1 Tax=Rhipicephalus microplus TaxID=6941 RepID=A0A9J6EBG6_RHIMP|nr:hypothetical protein HPB51_021048 [Rhipicephalus microplus]
MVTSTPERENAQRYVRIKSIDLGGCNYEIYAYEAAPDDTCKGVIRNIDIVDGPVELERNIVNPRNPLALAAKRIKNTGTVMTAFDGYKVPNFVIGCGEMNVIKKHRCQPRCELCGGPHLTVDKMYRQRYTIPYVVRRRKCERAIAANAEKEQVDNSLILHSSKLHSTASAPMDYSKPTAASCGRSRSRNRSRSRGGSVSRSRRRSASRSKYVVRSGNRSPLINPESEGGIGSTWVDKVKELAMMDKTPTTRGQSSDNRRLAWANGARTVRLRVGDTNSDVVQLGDHGTPHGSAISPVLFNLCMISLSKKLSNISNIHHAIYADDLTIWCAGSSEGQIQDALTEAV